MSHNESLGAGSFLAVFWDKRIVVGYLPLLVVQIGVGLVVSLTLRVAHGLLVFVNRAEPSAAYVGQHIIVLNGVGHSHTAILDIDAYHGSDAYRILVQGAHVLGNVLDCRRNDDAAIFLVVQRYDVLLPERSCCPVVQGHIELAFCLARSLYHLLICQRLVLVEREMRSQISCCIKPLVSVALLGIFLKVARFHHLSLRTTNTESHECRSNE